MNALRKLMYRPKVIKAVIVIDREWRNIALGLIDRHHMTKC